MSQFTDRLRVATKAAVGIFSENSWKQAQGLLSGVLPGGLGVAPTRGTAEYLRAYSQMPWLRAVTSRIATATARAEWQLFAAQKKGAARAYKDVRVQRADMHHRRKLLKEMAAADELRQIVDHPMLDVLHNANEFQTGYAMRKVTQLHVDLVGDAFWLKERDAGGMVVGVWPVPPHWIIATPTPLFRFFRVSFRAWRGNIPDTEFLWFSDPDPLNPYGRGSGSAMALGDELDTDEYAARHTKAFFYNSARPDIIVSPKGGPGMNEAGVKRLEEDWTQQTNGFWRAFKPYFMTREVNVEVIPQNFKAMEFTKLREFERNIVLQHYGVPPEVLGVIENSNRSTIDAADYMMNRYVIEPRLEFQRTVLQERFAPEFDERLIVEYVSPVQEDVERYLEVSKAAPFALSVDEWREMAGHGPMDDKAAGKLHAIPTLVKLGPIEVTPPPPAPVAPMAPAGGGAAPGAPTATQPGEGRRALMIVASGWSADLAADVTAATDAGDVALATAIHKSMADVLDDLPEASAVAAKQEAGLARALLRSWDSHAARLDLAKLAAAALGPDAVAGDVITLLDLAGLNAAQTAAIDPLLVRAVKKGAETGGMALRRRGVAVRAAGTKPGGLQVDLQAINPAAIAWAKAHAALLVQATPEVRAIILDLVARALDEGIAPLDLARLIRDVVGLLPRQATAVANFRQRLAQEGLASDVLERRVERYALAQRRARALNIARTELISATNAGQQLVWNAAVTQGVIRQEQFNKVWITTPDERLCEEVCEGMEGEEVALDEAFSSGDEYPPAHPSCRCAIGLEPVDTIAPARTATPATPSVGPPAVDGKFTPYRRERTVKRDDHENIAVIIDEYLPLPQPEKETQS